MMRTFSTPQSAFNNEITKLAIIECIFAAALYIGIGMYINTFRYLAMGVVFSPLMLLRTEVSADWGLKINKRFEQKFFVFYFNNKFLNGDKNVFWHLLKAFSFGLLFCPFLWLPLVRIGIRIIATTYWALRKPLYTLKNAPQNWIRQAFCTDFAHPPEMLPLESLRDEEADLPIRYIDVWALFNKMKLIKLSDHKKRNLLYHLGRIEVILIGTSLFLVGWLPSIIYRVSFKATVLVYAPFIWVVQLTLHNSLPVKARLERITKGELEKVRRQLSWILLAALISKLALFFGWIDKSFFLSKYPSELIVTDLVIPDRWPWWQLTLLAEALLTFFLFFFSDAAIPRLNDGKIWSNEGVLKTTSTVSLLRAVLGIITISYFFQIALRSTASEVVNLNIF